MEKAAENGIIRPEETEEIIKWWNNRPEAVDRLFPYPYTLATMRGWPMMTSCGNVTRKRLITPDSTEKIKLRWKNKLQALSYPVPRLSNSKVPRVKQRIPGPDKATEKRLTNPDMSEQFKLRRENRNKDSKQLCSTAPNLQGPTCSATDCCPRRVEMARDTRTS